MAAWSHCNHILIADINGHTAVVELLAAAGDPSALTVPLWNAAKKGDVAAVEALLAEGKVQIDLQGEVVLCCVWL